MSASLHIITCNKFVHLQVTATSTVVATHSTLLKIHLLGGFAQTQTLETQRPSSQLALPFYVARSSITNIAACSTWQFSYTPGHENVLHWNLGKSDYMACCVLICKKGSTCIASALRVQDNYVFKSLQTRNSPIILLDRMYSRVFRIFQAGHMLLRI